jgi:hypothetical protein
METRIKLTPSGRIWVWHDSHRPSISGRREDRLAAQFAACRRNILETWIELAPRQCIWIWHLWHLGYLPVVLVDRFGKDGAGSANNHENSDRQSDDAAHWRLPPRL